jgi:nicotinate phosphoribosyltransferase
MAFDREEDAMRAYAEEFPDAAILLVDTYDTRHGVELACRIGRELASRGKRLTGVRLDSGDLAEQARMARGRLDEAGLVDTQIFASGDLNEIRIAELVRAGAPVDAFGVGTELGTSPDAPALGGVYKLVEYAGRGRMKRSTGKATLPGPKQVWRAPGFNDVIELADAPAPDGEPLLICVMEGGRIIGELPSLESVRRRCLDGLSALPDDLRDLSPGRGHEPGLGPELREATATYR